MHPIPVFAAAGFLSLALASPAAAQARPPQKGIDPLQGAWELVWSTSRGKAQPGKPQAYRQLHDGFYALLLQDSLGRWNQGAAGTYTLVGNTYTERVRHDTDAPFTGWQFQQVTLRGDTLVCTLFTRVRNAQGQDVSAQWPRRQQERWVRAKK
jgi:hypothetical protein